MDKSNITRVGYVVKRYPRFSETFIVNEILAHEASGWPIEIFSLFPPSDAHFQDSISRVRAPVTYLSNGSLKGTEFWEAIKELGKEVDSFQSHLEVAYAYDARSVYQALVLAKEISKREIQHLHAHFASSATTVAKLASHFTGVPYSVTAHAKDIFHESVVLKDLQQKFTQATGVITVSDYNIQYLKKTVQTPSSNLFRIYNGLDLERYPYLSPKNRRPKIIGVGRLVEKKGFKDLIQACAILAQRNTDFSCDIIGVGDQGPSLHSQIERLGLESKVRLLGARPQQELIELVQESAVFAAPCVVAEDGNRDGLPTVLIEAMALGTPCISTDVTGIPELVRDGQTGIITKQHDPLALADAMQKLLTNDELRIQLATEARRLIESEFDVQQNAKKVRAVFQLAHKK